MMTIVIQALLIFCEAREKGDHLGLLKGRNPGLRSCISQIGCGGQIWTDDLRVMSLTIKP